MGICVLKRRHGCCCSAPAMGTIKSSPSNVGTHELRGIEALQHSLRTGAELRRRPMFGRESVVSANAAYALWGAQMERELVCVLHD